MAEIDLLRDDPQPSYSFTAFTSDQTIPQGAVGFTEIGDIKSSTAVIDYGEGTDTFDRKIPGKTTVDVVPLTHGLDKKRYLWNWYNQVREDVANTQDGAPSPNFRKTLFIQQMTRGKEPFRTWKLYNAWVSDYTVTGLRRSDNEVTFARIEVCCERMEEISEL